MENKENADWNAKNVAIFLCLAKLWHTTCTVQTMQMMDIIQYHDHAQIFTIAT